MSKRSTKAAPAAAVNGNARPPREGRVLIGGHFLPAVSRELKILAIRENKALVDLLHEAVNDLFIKRGLPAIETITA